MEQWHSFSPGVGLLSPDDLVARLQRAPAPLRRGPLKGPGGETAEGRPPRGDHDLNPELYDPSQPLIGAAVLVPIVEHASGPTVLLTKRTDHLHDHAGQISFPGGRIDPGDADAHAAALREAEEEIGLPPQQVRSVARLDTYVVRTGFEVFPIVGLVTPPLDLRLDSFEVAEAFEVPLGFFLDPANRQTRSRMFRGEERHFYVFPYGDYYIWGATAGMLVNLAEVLTKP